MLFLLADTVTCFEKIKDFSDLRNNARFWLEGIAITLLGLVGLAGNFLSIAVLNTYKTNTSFNRLLMSLAVVDSLLIIDMVLEKAVIGNFVGSEPIWYKISYPYFWHPCKGGLISEGSFKLVPIFEKMHEFTILNFSTGSKKVDDNDFVNFFLRMEPN